MTQKISPYVEGKYGWEFGENGWNTGMDENLLKFSFLFDRNVDSIISSLPAAVNGQSHYNTTDNRIYFAVGTTYYSTPTPKWFIISERVTGDFWQFNGTDLVAIDAPEQVDSRLDAVELTLSTLGTAAFEDSSIFATQAALDVAVANSEAYTDSLASSLASDMGSNLIGHRGQTLYQKLSKQVDPLDFGAVGDGVADDTAALVSMFAEVEATGAAIVDYSGNTYKYVSSIIVNGDIIIRGNITFFGQDASITIQGSLTEVGSVAAAVTKSSNTVSLTSTSGLIKNDLLILQNTVASSYSPHRTNYFDGEYVRVEDVSTGSITTQSNLLTSYSGVTTDKVFKVNPVKVEIDGGVSFTGGDFYTLFVKYGVDCKISAKLISNTKASAAAVSALGLDKCYNCQVTSGRFERPYVATANTNYGIVLMNCQSVTISKVDSFGGRHPVTAGGDAQNGAVPNRFIYVEDSILSNDPESAVYAADFHGNTIDSFYRNCVINGRIGLAGENVAAIDCTIHSHPNDTRAPLGYHELVGGDLSFIGCKVLVGSGSTSANIVSNLDSGLSAKITKPYNVVVKRLDASLNSNVSAIINAFENSGQVNTWTLEDFMVRGDTSALTRFITFTLVAPGVDADIINITNPGIKCRLALLWL